MGLARRAKRWPAALLAVAVAGVVAVGCGPPGPPLALENDGVEAEWKAPGRRLETGFRVAHHVLVPATLEGAGPFDFVLDSGAPVTLLVGTRRTARLGLEPGASFPLGGSGVGAAPVGRAVEGLELALQDLGSRGALTLIPGGRPGLAAPAATIDSRGWGASGETAGRLGRIAELRLGPHALEYVIARFSTSGHETAADRHGVLGLGVPERFRVIFDYPRRRLLLAPTRETREPFEADMRGLVLSPDRSGVRVEEVLDGTPAATAGFQAGDRLRSLDGENAADLELPEIQARLRQGPDQAVALCVDREPAAPHCADLRLRRGI